MSWFLSKSIASSLWSCSIKCNVPDKLTQQASDQFFKINWFYEIQKVQLVGVGYKREHTRHYLDNTCTCFIAKESLEDLDPPPKAGPKRFSNTCKCDSTSWIPLHSTIKSS